MANVLTNPKDYSYRPAALRAALAIGGSYDYDGSGRTPSWRLRPVGVETSLLPSGGGFPRATVQLMLEPDRFGSAVALSDLPNLIPAHARIAIYGEVPAGQPGEGDREFLFEGYPTVGTLSFSGQTGSGHQSYTITCTSLLEQLASEKGSHVYGQYVYDAALYVSLIRSLPCVFNAGGKPNRASILSEGWGEDGLRVPVFTWVGDSTATYWTYGDALLYLLACYTLVDPPVTPIADGNGIALCRELSLNADDEAYEIKNLTSAVNPALADVLQSKCDELTCEGLSLVEALLLWCQLSGCALQQYTATEGGAPVTSFYFSYQRDGGPWQDAPVSGERTPRLLYDDEPLGARPVMLGRSGDNLKEMTASDATENNEVYQGSISYDTANVLNNCRVLGAPEKYEVRAEGFMPGWKADTAFGDNLDEAGIEAKLEVIAAIRDAGSVEELDSTAAALWHKYDTSGKDFLDYEMIGRVWILNDSGEYTTVDYGRTGAAQSAWATYAAFDFHTACTVPLDKNPSTGTRDVAWVPRRRKMLPPIVKGPHGEALPVYVEVSWDSGTKWYPYGHNAKLSEDQCGIYLADANLAKITCPDDDAVDVWSAIIQGIFRLRATFSVEGDTRVEGNGSLPASLIPLARSHAMHVFNGMRYENPVDGTSVFKNITGYTNITTLDEYARADALAYRFLSQSSSRRISASLEIPWITKKYLPGDLISGIEPRGIRFDATQGRGTEAQYPQIVSVRWVNGDGGPVTTLTLDDRRNDVTS